MSFLTLVSRTVTHGPRTVAIGLTTMTLLASADVSVAEAQAPTIRHVELRPFAGAMLPTGDQRDLLDDAFLAGLQVGYRFTRHLALVGTFSWAGSNDKQGWGTPVANRGADVDVFQYDLGIEGRLAGATTGAVTFTPFALLGVGGRTYNYRDVDDVDAQTNLTGFASAGTDIGPRGGRWAIRVEARDYVSAFKGLRGERGDRTARNDVQLSSGLAIAF